MFEAIKLSKPLSKIDYEAVAAPLRVDLLNAQFDLVSSDFSVLILLTGDDRQGVEQVIDLLHEWLDPRGLDATIFEQPRCDERRQPSMMRLWKNLPSKGRIGIYSGMWSLSAIAERMDGTIDDKELDHRANHLVRFEQTLIEDGTLVIKYWLHLPKETRERQVKEAMEEPKRRWDIESVDRIVAHRFDRIRPIVEQFLSQTNHALAPWRVMDGSEPRSRNVALMQDLLKAMSKRLATKPSTEASIPLIPSTAIPEALTQVDLSVKLDSETYDRQIEKQQARLYRFSHRAQRRDVASVLVFEGWDAAGKGGAIRRLTRAMDAVLYRVVPISAPTDEELAHHYLWRFWRQIPRDGRMVIFDRSWYGRVLVERVERLTAPKRWRAAYDEINEFETNLIEHGIVLRKFWLHISEDEQRRRFEERGKTPYKKYKYTADDLRNRSRWSDYMGAADEMIFQTNTVTAPWHLISAEDKPHARIAVLREVNRALKQGTTSQNVRKHHV